MIYLLSTLVLFTSTAKAMKEHDIVPNWVAFGERLMEAPRRPPSQAAIMKAHGRANKVRVSERRPKCVGFGNDAYGLPFIYLGNRALAGNQDQISDLGITHIVSADWKEPSTMKEQEKRCEFIGGLQFKGVAIKDDEGGSRDLFQKHIGGVIDFIDSAFPDGEICDNKVLIHCHAGTNRSAAMLIAYMIRKSGEDLRTIIDHVRKMGVLQYQRSYDMLDSENFLAELFLWGKESDRSLYLWKEGEKIPRVVEELVDFLRGHIERFRKDSSYEGRLQACVRLVTKLTTMQPNCEVTAASAWQWYPVFQLFNAKKLSN